MNWKCYDDALYLTDNGAVLCGQHLGCSARHTGRDISGQAIDMVTPEYVRAWQAEVGPATIPCACETCGRKATLLATAEGYAATH